MAREFETTTRYCDPLSPVPAVTFSDFVFAEEPEAFPHLVEFGFFTYHWYLSLLPLALTLKVWVLPLATVTDFGEVVIFAWILPWQW